MGNRTHAAPQQGFSIIEVMIALVILGVGLTAMTQLYKSGIDGGLYARQSSKAAALAQEKASELAPLLSAAQGGSEPKTDPSTNTTYTRKWGVSKDSNGTTKVSVTVTWPNPDDGKNPFTTTIDAVGQNYTPDILANRPVAVVAVVPVSQVFASLSSSSCKTYDDEDNPKGSCSGTVTGASMTVKKEDD